MRAILLAAGLGTRLRPLTDHLPKPMVPVLHRPLASYGLEVLARAGVAHVVINTHHLAEQVRSVSSYAPPGLEVAFSHEEQLLGTAGGVKRALAVQDAALGRRLAEDEPLLVWNGDVLFDPDLGTAMERHRTSGAVATMIVRADPEATRYGAIELGERHGVTGIRPVSAPAEGLMFTGIHLLSRRAVDALPPAGCIVQTGFRPWIASKQRILAVLDAAPWRDLGTTPQYIAANLERAAEHPGRAVHPTAYVDPRARVVDSVVGEGARIEGAISVERSVIWPRARVREPIRDAVRTGHER